MNTGMIYAKISDGEVALTTEVPNRQGYPAVLMDWDADGELLGVEITLYVQEVRQDGDLMLRVARDLDRNTTQ